MRMHDQWSVFFEQRDLNTKTPQWLSSWKGDGILSRITTPELSEMVQRNSVPMIELTDRNDETGSAHIRSDDAEIGRIAAEHLLDRGFKQFGYYGYENEAWSTRRQQAFVDRVNESGGACKIFNTPWIGPNVETWIQQEASVASWLGSFTGPVGIMTCNDLRGQQVLDVCSQQGISVPESVALVGVDNDELICRMCTPPLSSVVPNAEAIGFRAAEMLSRLMDGETISSKSQIVPPQGIATRQSTDVIAIEDEEIAAALSFIRNNASRGLSVDDVTKNVLVSRSKLERDFRKYLGRTPQQEIRMVQVKRARELLVSTELPIERIAFLCGFQSAEYMHVVFKRIVEQTPGEFRKQDHQSKS